jgi:hypothetical protein
MVGCDHDEGTWQESLGYLPVNKSFLLSRKAELDAGAAFDGGYTDYREVFMLLYCFLSHLLLDLTFR